ncbi:hypothetical protein [Nocardia paucivorans]|uniref:hypothetical protein n=1 Tax=Nocardia paucivorans TaxID=114259 RepID=UPI0002D5F91F|nr:hypothetical protein [Nocardia paucivorans]
MATVLKVLLEERHLKSHPDFLAAYDRCAAQLDPSIPPGYGPAKAQYYQWLSGRMVGLPRDHHCRVLEKMFPGWTVEGLFQRADPTTTTGRSHRVDTPVPDVRLESLLGTEMITTGATLVYPAFELTGQSVNALRTAGIPPEHILGKKDGAYPDRHHLDNTKFVPENEVRGLLYVFSLIGRYPTIPTTVHSDDEVVNRCDRPFISFGLSSNDCTHEYVETMKRPLFTIGKRIAEDGSYLEYVRLSDGKHYDSSDGRNLGMIARVRPNPDAHPDRYWIYCAGLGPRGTAGAGWYLANNWRPLQQRVGDREFVAVVGVHQRSDRATGLEHLLVEPTG